MPILPVLSKKFQIQNILILTKLKIPIFQISLQNIDQYHLVSPSPPRLSIWLINNETQSNSVPDYSPGFSRHAQTFSIYSSKFITLNKCLHCLLQMSVTTFFVLIVIKGIFECIVRGYDLLRIYHFRYSPVPCYLYFSMQVHPLRS